MRFLLDTCVLSEAWKSQPDPGVMEWLKANDADCHISMLSLGEIRKGIAKREHRTGLPQPRLSDWLNRLAAERRDDILPLGADVISLWGEIAGRAEAKGQTLPVIDSLIAATAMIHDLTVVTRNTEDFLRSGAKTFNPWQ